jgi:4-alpha-glucanotransferase
MADGPPRNIARNILQQRRLAGVLIPLFSLRTTDDLGRGEIRGLVPMADFALAIGHRMVQLLPVDETAPGETSPYSAMSVLAIDPLYISARGLDGVDGADIEVARASAGPGDPPDSLKLKAARMELLRKSFDHFAAKANPDERGAFEEFQERNREWLCDYALFRALKGKFRWCDWASWPDGLNRRAPSAIAAAARDLAKETSIYSYIQFVAHRQWQQVRADLSKRGVLLGGDLAFSPACESAEVWANQEMFDLTRTVGAPPDAFSKEGQRWGLPMPDWARMRAEGFALIRTRIRRGRELFDRLRIDHVVGLFRTYAFGTDPLASGAFDPPDEADQRAQGEEILRVVKAEAGSLEIFAEDLGVIPPFVRKSLAALEVPGYKVMRWERDWNVVGQPFIDPATYTELSVATTGTHDTETMAEWWRAASADERRQFVVSLKLAAAIDVRRKNLDDRAVDAILNSLYTAPSRLTIAPVQDLFGWEIRINLPGTVNAVNWKWRLPFALDRLHNNSDLASRIAALRAIALRSRRL